MTGNQLRVLRDRLYLQPEIPDEVLEESEAPYYRPPPDSVEYQYMMERRRALDGSLPRRVVRNRRPLELPAEAAYAEVLGGSGQQAASTTMAFTRLMRNLARDEHIGPAHRADHPRRGPHVRHGRAVPRVQDLRRRRARSTSPSTTTCMLSYTEAADGQILEEGITEAGSTASWIAAGTSYATRGVPMVPFYIFYSMFGFQRVGDLLWQAADSRTRGFLLGATAGRTTLLGEGLQHQDGHSLVLATTNPGVPGLRPGLRLRAGRHREARHPPHVRAQHGRRRPRRLLLPHPLQRELPDAADPGPARHRGRDRAGPLPVAGGARGPDASGPPSCSPVRPRAPPARRRPSWPSTTTSASSCGRPRRTRRCATRRSAVERWNRLHPGQSARTPLVTRLLADAAGPGRRRHRLHEAGARAGRPLRARPAVRAARHRRLRPLRHPRGAAPVLRGRRRRTSWWPCSTRWPSRAR